MQGKISTRILITKLQLKMTLHSFLILLKELKFLQRNIVKVSSDTKLFQNVIPGVYAENHSDVQIVSLQ